MSNVEFQTECVESGWTPTSTIGLQLDSVWTSFGLQLDSIWTMIGLHLDYSWTTFGSRLDYGSTAVRRRPPSQHPNSLSHVHHTSLIM